MESTIIKNEETGMEFEIIQSPVYLVHFYGAPIGYQDGIADKMNKGFTEGSWFRGSALLHFEVTFTIESTSLCLARR